MKFLYEYKKCLACLLMLVFLITIQSLSGEDMTPWIKMLMDGLIPMFFAGAVKFSVLKTSEREILDSQK